VGKLDAQPLIEINSCPLLSGKWFFDTGAGLTCISTQQFRLIKKQKTPTKLTLNQREARCASGTALIANDDICFQWNGTTKRLCNQ
jgi:hypothetical protein